MQWLRQKKDEKQDTSTDSSDNEETKVLRRKENEEAFTKWVQGKETLLKDRRVQKLDTKYNSDTKDVGNPTNIFKIGSCQVKT